MGWLHVPEVKVIPKWKFNPGWNFFGLHVPNWSPKCVFTRSEFHFAYIMPKWTKKCELCFEFSAQMKFVINNMDDKKRLMVILSCLSSILTSTLLLFQLHGVVLPKIMQQKIHLTNLNEWRNYVKEYRFGEISTCQVEMHSTEKKCMGASWENWSMVGEFALRKNVWRGMEKKF